MRLTGDLIQMLSTVTTVATRTHAVLFSKFFIDSPLQLPNNPLAQNYQAIVLIVFPWLLGGLLPTES